MLPLLDLPFVERQVDHLARAGVTTIVFSCGYRPREIEEYFGDGASRGLPTSRWRHRESSALIGLELSHLGQEMRNRLHDLRRTLATGLQRLRDLQGWLLWRYEDQAGTGKQIKVPYYADGGKRYGTNGKPRSAAETFSAMSGAKTKRRSLPWVERMTMIRENTREAASNSGSQAGSWAALMRAPRAAS
jgi:hypothetical protein